MIGLLGASRLFCVMNNRYTHTRSSAFCSLLAHSRNQAVGAANIPNVVTAQYQDPYFGSTNWWYREITSISGNCTADTGDVLAIFEVRAGDVASSQDFARKYWRYTRYFRGYILVKLVYIQFDIAPKLY